MKNTMQETYGNNIPTKKIKRIMIPLFNQENQTAVPGIKYFFPENPEIDRHDIKGMEAHLVRTPAKAAGDIKDGINSIATQAMARVIYLCLYNQNNEEIYYNLPLRSLFTYQPFATGFNVTKRIKPISCRLKTRSCYAYIPANVPPGTGIDQTYISITIYYN